MTDTNTLAGARGHARSQVNAGGPLAKVVPSTASGSDVIWDETLPVDGYASRRLPRGSVLELTDLAGDACVQLFVHNAAMPTERLCVADTVKVQWQAYLGPDALLLSDMGRVLMTLVADTSARHDCLCSATPRGRDLLCLGAAKFGLSRADVGPSIHLFKNVRVGDDGSLALQGEPAPGARVSLRAEMDVVVEVAVTPHPLDARPDAGNDVHCVARRGVPSTDTDPLRTTSPERLRAFENTDEWLLGFAP